MWFLYGGVCGSLYRTCNAESCPVFFASLGPVNEDGYFVCRKANGDFLSNIDIILRNSGKLLLLPYTKGFGRITHFLGNDLATVLYTAFCLDLLFKQLVGYKCTKDIGTIIQKREKASTLL